jgi:hypothetical protein
MNIGAHSADSSTIDGLGNVYLSVETRLNQDFSAEANQLRSLQYVLNGLGESNSTNYEIINGTNTLYLKTSSSLPIEEGYVNTKCHSFIMNIQNGITMPMSVLIQGNLDLGKIHSRLGKALFRQPEVK